MFPDSRICFYVEGEKKAIALWAQGLPAISLFGIHNWHKEWLSGFRKWFEYHLVMFDGDGPHVKQQKVILANQLRGTVLSLGGKPDDLLAKSELATSPIRGISPLILFGYSA